MATGDTTKKIKPDEDKTMQSTSTRTGETKSGLTGSFKYNITVHDEFEPSSLQYSPEYEGVTTLTAGTTLSADVTLGTPTFDPSKEETINFNPTEDFIYVDTITSGVKVDAKTQAVTGEGILDKLMETTNTHLQAQFEAGRIRLEDYANAYVSILTNNLQVATQLAMGMSNDRVMRYKAEQEIKTMQSQDRVMRYKAEQEIKTMQSQDRVMRYKAEQEIKQANAQARLIEVQRKNAIAEREVLTAKTNAEINKMIDDMYQQDRKVTSDISATTTKLKDDLENSAHQRVMLAQQKEVLVKKTNAELKKLNNDKKLVEEQINSEREKKKLYFRQRQGFDEDSQLKLFKHMSDSWGLAYSVAGDSDQFDYPPYMKTKKGDNEGVNMTDYPVKIAQNIGKSATIATDVTTTDLNLAEADKVKTITASTTITATS